MRDLPDCREQFSSIRRVGHVPALRWFGCGKRAGWASEVMLEACPRCGGELVERSERRQRWLQGHDRKRDALAALAAVVAEADRGGFYIEPSKRKLADFLVNDWLPGGQGDDQIQHIQQLRGTVRVHIVPALGDIELRALAPAHLNAAYATWLANGRSHGSGLLSANSVLHFHVVLHRALKDAVRWGFLSRNVLRDGLPPTAPKGRDEGVTAPRWRPS